MKFLHLVWRGLLRRKLRTLFTALSIFIAFLLVLSIFMAMDLSWNNVLAAARNNGIGAFRSESAALVEPVAAILARFAWIGAGLTLVLALAGGAMILGSYAVYRWQHGPAPGPGPGGASPDDDGDSSGDGD